MTNKESIREQICERLRNTSKTSKNAIFDAAMAFDDVYNKLSTYEQDRLEIEFHDEVMADAKSFSKLFWVACTIRNLQSTLRVTESELHKVVDKLEQVERLGIDLSTEAGEADMLIKLAKDP